MPDSSSLSRPSQLPQVENLIRQYPEFIHKDLALAFEKVAEQWGQPEQTLEHWGADYLNEVLSAFSRSDFVAESCARFPQWLDEWCEADSFLRQDQSRDAMATQLSEEIAGLTTEAELMRVLRIFRRKHMCRIIWRDLLQHSPLEQTLAEVSALADVAVSQSLDWLHRQAVEKYGQPLSVGKDKVPQTMLVLGMGKLGAAELNVSSDIDLIFAYPKSGETDHPRKPIDNHQFFTKLGQRLINVLDQQTGDGFVFRVDMRLRPYGSSGALALNFSAFEDYYQNQGREWERFAMIKTRVIAGNSDDGRKLLEIIRPFVYRRYADFSSFEALRDMKRMIMSEVHRKGGDQNIKLGNGGIREIEFIVQACQLIYGGIDASLQQPGLLPVFERIKEEAYLPPDWIDRLVAANHFLRRLEHAIQGLDDKQTQLIPSSVADRERVAWSLGYESWDLAANEMASHRQRVAEIFNDFLHESDEEEDAASDEMERRWLHLWQARASVEQWTQALDEAGYEAAAASAQLLNDMQESRQYSVMSKDAKKRFEQFLPHLLTEVCRFPAPSVTLERLLGFVRVILGRTVYLVLLYENIGALRRLCDLCSDSPWIAEHLAKSPVILDELLDANSLYQPPEKSELEDELRQAMLRIPEDDLESQMDALRTFRQSHMLRVAAAELSGTLPLMKVSDYLTWLAEVLVAEAVQIAWRNLVAKYGAPADIASDEGEMGFAVIGYGKLGGIELSYSSDLDMVFIYGGSDHGSTNGLKPINNQVFYTRLGQRIIHILSTQTTQGSLYEVDMRLRPSGKSGMLVSSLAAFEKYQRNEAWTWEHQALVRTRFIAGDLALSRDFEKVRNSVLSARRDAAVLQQDVIRMREKMRAAAVEKYGGAEAARNHIKQGEGGLIDIEFITQFGVLLHAPDQAELLQWSDNIRLLETMSKLDSFEGVDLVPLIDAYRTLRSAQHRKSLAGPEYSVSLADFPEVREKVSEIWSKIFSK